jgi:hypothetical protein
MIHLTTDDHGVIDYVVLGNEEDSDFRTYIYLEDKFVSIAGGLTPKEVNDFVTKHKKFLKIEEQKKASNLYLASRRGN